MKGDKNMAIRKTLANARKDPRVYEIEVLDPEEFGSPGYCVSLEDGYELDDGSTTAYVSTVKEVWGVLDNEIIKID
jgi:hypothetical protein